MQLLTERLILRDFHEDDWPAVLAYQSDPRYLRYVEWTRRTPEDAQAFVQMFLRGQQRQRRAGLEHPGQQADAERLLAVGENVPSLQTA